MIKPGKNALVPYCDKCHEEGKWEFADHCNVKRENKIVDLCMKHYHSPVVKIPSGVGME